MNYSRETCRRIVLSFPVGLSTDIDALRILCLDILKNEAQVLKDKPYEVVIDKMDERSILIGVYCWVKYENYWDTYHKLFDAIQKNRSKAVEIPAESVRILNES